MHSQLIDEWTFSTDMIIVEFKTCFKIVEIARKFELSERILIATGLVPNKLRAGKLYALQ